MQVGLVLLGSEAWVGAHQAEGCGAGPEQKMLCADGTLCTKTGAGK